ncbi:unnamed protein product [Vicia faba]|uniref:DUF4283 domain-containing protein n=1 Tax=Vicia faba TaxID=3906 RepID=A0AAV0ZKS1_VICFA|nr:unnamed protein product [Vicia faba]
MVRIVDTNSNNDVWTKVVNKNGSGKVITKWDVSGSGRRKGNGLSLSTFFVIKFNDKWRANDLYVEFKLLGDINEVFVPPKRDKRGRRYGSVRFFNVEDERRTFADVTQNNLDTCLKEVKGIRLTTRSLSYSADVDDMRWLVKAFVGKALEPEMTYNMKRLFNDDGIFSIIVTPLGANFCLLEDLVDGIPCHAWNAKFFELIFASLGTYVNCDVNTLIKLSLDVAIISIRTRPGKGGSDRVENIGPTDGTNLTKGPRTFNDACKKLKTVKPKRRKVKEVRDLGEKVEFIPSYYACIFPRKNGETYIFSSSTKAGIREDDSISNGTFPFCNSLIDSEVLRCNRRLLKNEESEVGKKIWDLITKLGAVSRVERVVSIKEVENMESKDKKGVLEKKAVLNVLL